MLLFYTLIEIWLILFCYFRHCFLKEPIVSQFMADIHTNVKSILLEFVLCFVDHMNCVQLGRLLDFSLSKLHYSKEYKKRIRIQRYWCGNELCFSIPDKTFSFRTVWNFSLGISDIFVCHMLLSFPLGLRDLVQSSSGAFFAELAEWVHYFWVLESDDFSVNNNNCCFVILPFHTFKGQSFVTGIVFDKNNSLICFKTFWERFKTTVNKDARPYFPQREKDKMMMMMK